MKTIIRNLRRSVVVSIFFFLLCGLAYPLLETGIAQAVFPHQANGSMSAQGSSLVGQSWSGNKWFHGRPDEDNPMATGAANLGPRSKVLVKDVAGQVASLKKLGIRPTSDLVTTSGSGVDPDISPADAYAQVAMISKARGIPVKTLDRLITRLVHGPQWGFLGASYIDVLELNVALSHLH